jgi:hypothetical protein
LKEQIVNIEKALIYQTGTQRPAVSQNRTDFRAKVKMHKEQCIEVILPLTYE